MSAVAAVLRHIRKLVEAQRTQPSDRQLLERFAAQRDQAAFATLVDRHGEMVRNTCRRTLRNEQNAEDAFQAVFLVLARKAGSIAWHESVGSWLHSVAYRVASELQRKTAARQHHEAQAAATEIQDPSDSLPLGEVRSILDEELRRLPERYRAPLLLCYWEGCTQEEAARQLGWSAGTLKGRLDRGRERLRRRLQKRGITGAGALGAALLVSGPATARMSTAVQAATTEAAMAFASRTTGVASTSAVALAEAALQGLTLTKQKLVARVVLAVTLLIAGSAVLAHQLGTGNPQAREDDGQPPMQNPLPGPLAEVARVDAYGDPLPPGAVARLGTLRLRQGSYVSCLAIAPGGQTVASGGLEDGVLRLWDAASGKEHPAPDAGYVSWVSFAPDGKTMASNGGLWDVATGKNICKFAMLLEGAAYAPDSKTFAIASTDGAGGAGSFVSLWDVATGKTIRTFTVEPFEDDPAAQPIGCQKLAYAPDGKTLALARQGKAVRLWDVASGKEISAFDHPDNVYAVAYAPDNKTLATAGKDKTVRLWDLASGKVIRVFRTPAVLSLLAYAPDGKTLASGGGLTNSSGDRDRIRLWDLASGQERQAFDGYSFAYDDKLLAIAYSSTVRLWEPASGKEILAFDHHQSRVSPVTYLPDGKTLASASYGEVRLWDLGSSKQVRAFKIGGGCLAFAPDGKTLAWASWDEMGFADIATGKETRRSKRHRVEALAYAPDGTALVLRMGGESAVRLWDVANDKEIRECSGHQPYSFAVAYAPDGKTVASGGTDWAVRLWDVASGKEIRTLALPRPGGSISVGVGIAVLAYAPDGKIVAAANPNDNKVWLWDVQTGKQIHALQHPGNWVASLVFAPDSKTLASGCGAKVRLWDVVTGQEIAALAGHQGDVCSLAFALDGKRLASASQDTTILIWDLFAGLRQHPPSAPTEEQLQALWGDLQSTNVTRSYRAVISLTQAPQEAVPFLRARVQPIMGPTAERLQQLIADLDSDQFAVRQKAGQELEVLQHLAEPALREVLEGKPSLEMSRRVNALLNKLQGWSGECLRLWRVIQVLEGIGTPGAQAVLKTLAQGAPGSRLTQEAKASLGRLTR
jgi:RNA polymerase sigma factor (sigma-70 family)